VNRFSVRLRVALRKLDGCQTAPLLQATAAEEARCVDIGPIRATREMAHNVLLTPIGGLRRRSWRRCAPRSRHSSLACRELKFRRKKIHNVDPAYRFAVGFRWWRRVLWPSPLGLWWRRWHRARHHLGDSPRSFPVGRFPLRLRPQPHAQSRFRWSLRHVRSSHEIGGDILCDPLHLIE